MELKRAYRRILRVRRFEEQLPALLKAGELVGSVYLCTGQEAIPVGACSALEPRDGAEVVARVAETPGPDLRSGTRVGIPDARVPASPRLSRAVLPTMDRIAAELTAFMQVAPSGGGRR